MYYKLTRPTKQATLCFVLEDGKILLAMKKRGFGTGKYNGYGGKVQENETIEQAAVREFMEESCLSADEKDLRKVGELDFYFPYNPKFDQTVHVYIVTKYSGIPKETEEMAFEWFRIEEIPYSKMWDDDKHWMPLMLQGKKIKGAFKFKEENGESIVDLKEISENF